MTTACHESTLHIDKMIGSSSLLLDYVYDKLGAVSNIKNKSFKNAATLPNSIDIVITNHHNENVETFQKYVKITEPVLIDVIVPMEPKKKFRAKMRVKSIKKGELDSSEPEVFVDPEDY